MKNNSMHCFKSVMKLLSLPRCFHPPSFCRWKHWCNRQEIYLLGTFSYANVINNVLLLIIIIVFIDNNVNNSRN